MSSPTSNIQFRASRKMRHFDDSVFNSRRIVFFRINGLKNTRKELPSISQEMIQLLPTTADQFYESYHEGHEHEAANIGWTELTKTILEGVRSGDESSCPLWLIRNHEHTSVRKIYFGVWNEYAKHVKLTLPASFVGNAYDTHPMRFSRGRKYPEWQSREMGDIEGIPAGMKSQGYAGGFVAFSKCGQIAKFPTPADRNVNMMPFILGDQDSLPENLQCYHPLIEQCPYVMEEVGKVAYLTVHESFVKVGDAQRRQGLHIESPGIFLDGDDSPAAASFTPGVEHPWGMGVFFGPDHYEGGIYFASNVSDTSEVWDALVDCSVPGIVDRHGGCEHLRGIIGNGSKLQAGELVWVTDKTPHEALSQTKSGYRQFFRVVMPYISHWYSEHSTPNPRVNLPDSITVIHGNKFVVPATTPTF